MRAFLAAFLSSALTAASLSLFISCSSFQKLGRGKERAKEVQTSPLPPSESWDITTGASDKGDMICGQSGVEALPPLRVSIGLKGKSLSQKMLKRLQQAEKRPRLRRCPKACPEANVYKANVRIFPAKAKTGSCPAAQAREKYHFIKTFSAPRRGGSSPAAARAALESQMSQWILRTFVYPYMPGKKFSPTKELMERQTGKACPDCSFYFDYSYFYETSRRLKLNIKVRCGDRKKGLSLGRRAVAQIKNYWRCAAPAELSLR